MSEVIRNEFEENEEGISLFEENGEEAEETGEEIFDILSKIQAMRSAGFGDSSDDDDEEENLEADDYHNKATDMARRNKFKKAVSICKEGLEIFPTNIDLLADVVNYSSSCGDNETASKYFEELLNQPRQSFNWRAYTFALDYLMKDCIKNEALCRELIADYKKYIPFEEKSAVAESELEAALGNHELSQKILEEAIERMGNASQCALRLADIQLKKGLFEEVVKTVNYAMMSSAEVQPSINIPYLVYVRCLAKDALLHKKAAVSSVTSEEVAHVKEQYELLKTSFPLIRMKFNSEITDRIAMLSFISAN